MSFWLPVIEPSSAKRTFSTLPALSGLSRLELASCSRLEALPPSLGALTAVSLLDCQSCSSLRALPDSVGNLSALRQLNLKDCRQLAALPWGLSELSNLSLCIEGCESLERPPEAAEWSAEIYCRQLAGRAAPIGTPRDGCGTGETDSTAVQPSDLTRMCMEMLQLS